VNGQDPFQSPRFIAVGGCKGGVGKSVVSCALAVAAGRLGKDVILVDCDLGGPNLHTLLGIQEPAYVISDFISRRVKNIDDIVIDTNFSGVRLISCAGNAPSQANPRYAQKLKLLKNLQSLQADIIILDVGAGSSNDVMDFFSKADDKILVTTPEPTSVVNSYGFLKNVVYRRLTFAFRQNSLVTELIKRGMNPTANGGIRSLGTLMDELFRLNKECWVEAKQMLIRFVPNIILNKCTCAADTLVNEKLKAIIEKYLAVECRCLGEIMDDPVVRVSARKMVPFLALAPESKAAICMDRIVDRVLWEHPSTSDMLDENRWPTHEAPSRERYLQRDETQLDVPWLSHSQRR
jgi:flagellar biosynthesis protein FlhG